MIKWNKVSNVTKGTHGTQTAVTWVKALDLFDPSTTTTSSQCGLCRSYFWSTESLILTPMVLLLKAWCVFNTDAQGIKRQRLWQRINPPSYHCSMNRFSFIASFSSLFWFYAPRLCFGSLSPLSSTLFLATAGSCFQLRKCILHYFPSTKKKIGWWVYHTFFSGVDENQKHS